ncbi:MAG: PTS transporter subunit EIIC, partial [Atopostipes sp.]|nr:PTS transporter subunit EIIC [Atopostipes sp.]
MMEKFNNFMERSIVPFAAKLNEQRHVAAIRDSFMYTFPITMAASIVILINGLIFSEDGFVAQVLHLSAIFPNLSDMQSWLSSVTTGTLDILSIFIAYLVASILAKHFKGDELLTGMTSIAVFMIFYTPAMEQGDVQYLPTTFLGAQGLYVAMLIGALVGEFLPS